jgi:Thioesterase domain
LYNPGGKNGNHIRQFTTISQPANTSFYSFFRYTLTRDKRGILPPFSKIRSEKQKGTIKALLSKETAHGTAESDPRAQVLALQTGGSRPPFFYVYGDWFDGGAYVLQLARELGPNQPFYGLAPYEFDRELVPPSFEEVAAAHIAAMRTIQSEGPYLLGGFCNGGLLAYEMARQLHAQRQEVALVILIDPATPYSHRSLRRLISSFGKLLHLDPNTQVNCFLRYLYARIPAYRRKVQASVLQSMTSQPGQQPVNGAKAGHTRLFPPAAALRYQWSGIYRWVEAGYLPGRYPGKLTVVWSSEAFTERVDWGRISGAQEVAEHVFPGTHNSCKNTNLPVLAERLRTCLAQHLSS